MNIDLEYHPLEPFIPEGSKLLMLGTFPPKQEKWSMRFFYPNFINDMWRIYGQIFFDDKNYFVDADIKSFKLDLIKEMLQTNKIALSDSAQAVRRLKDNASDKYLDIVIPISIKEILNKIPNCKAIATTGEKAAGVIASLTNSELPKMGMSVDIKIADRKLLHYRMPSTSRAYPLKFDSKVDCYKQMLIDLEILK